jgi:hypothetical protein
MDEDDRRWQAMMEQSSQDKPKLASLEYQPRPGLFYPFVRERLIHSRIARAFHTEPFRMTLEDTGWLSVPFCGPFLCDKVHH